MEVTVLSLIECDDATLLWQAVGSRESVFAQLIEFLTQREENDDHVWDTRPASLDEVAAWFEMYFYQCTTDVTTHTLPSITPGSRLWINTGKGSGN